MKTILISIVLSLIMSVAFGQNNTEKVYDTDIVLKNLERYGQLDDYYKWKEKAYSDFKEMKETRGIESTNLIRYIPVVVHVIHNPDNPSDSLVPDEYIYQFIETVNQDFTRTNPDVGNTRSIFSSVTGDAQINLCLASQDIDGGTTTGIIRTETTVTSFSSSSDDMKATSTGGADGWDSHKYLNVWICNMSNGAGSGVAGFAYFPSSHGSAIDGLVLDSDIGVGIYNGQVNRTASHELGHYFGLNHIWGDGDCDVDDGFDDTPTSNYDNMDVTNCNPATEPNSCFVDSTDDLPDQYENYMSYSSCQNMFTAEQCAFMNSTLSGERASLLSSTGCEIALQADFTPGTQVTIREGGIVTFIDLSIGSPISWEWTFPGGIPDSYIGQNPPTVIYNDVGVYDVTLYVEDGTFDSRETKTLLVNVEDDSTWPVADYTMSSAGASVGGTISFADASTNEPTSWVWHFSGGTPEDVSVQNPGEITYNVPPGVYDVTLYVSNDEGYDDTLGTVIVVAASDVVPEAKFAAPFTTIFAGSTVSFIDLSTGNPFTWSWNFYGASSTQSSVTQNPSDIRYDVPGQYPVSLMVSNSLGMDSIRKEMYITVIDSLGEEKPIPLFTVDQRLIVEGQSINFQNLSLQMPVQWAWEFEGGVLNSSTDENPLGITYSTSGTYDVTLTVTNANGSRSLTKYDYIVVTPVDNQLPDYCNTLSNVPTHERVVSEKLSSTWGWMPGHNGYDVRAYADYFNDYTYSQINSVNIPVRHSYSGTDTSTITVKVWRGNTRFPEEVMASKKVLISSLSPAYFNPIHFDEPVILDGPFFLGYELNYTSKDTFATYMADNRGTTGDNTAYARNAEGNWDFFYRMFNIHTSLLIEPDVCLVGINDVFMENDIVIYPNPSQGIVNIGIGESSINKHFDIYVYDLFGRKIKTEVNNLTGGNYQLDLSKNAKGIYLINMIIDGKVLVKKISIM